MKHNAKICKLYFQVEYFFTTFIENLTNQINYIMKLKLFILSILAVLLVVLISIFFTEKQKAPIPKSKYKIGILMHETQHRWEKDIKYLKKQFKAKKIRAIVRDAKNDAQTQYKQAEELILKYRVKTLIIVPEDSEKAKRIVDLAKKHGVKVIAYDRLILNCDLDLFIGNDVINIGEQIAKAATSSVSSGNYVIIGGGRVDENSRLIRIGVDNILEEKNRFGEIKIIFDEYTKNWKREEAYNIMQKLIKSNKKIDAILAFNDNLALGAIDAIEESNSPIYDLNKIFIVGQDATVEGCRSIVQGKLDRTIYKPIHIEAYTTAMIACKVAQNKSISEFITGVTNNGKKLVSSITIPYTHIVGEHNLDMTIIFDKFHTKKEIYD